MNRIILSILVISVSCSVLYPQDSLTVNTTYLAFEIDRSPVISVGYFMQDQLALEVGVGMSLNGENDSNGLLVRLEFDRYLSASRLTPLYGGSLGFEINPNAFEGGSQKGSRLVLGGHFGIHLLILENFSVAGIAGLELLMDSPSQGDDYTTFTTFTSGVKFRFLF